MLSYEQPLRKSPAKPLPNNRLQAAPNDSVHGYEEVEWDTYSIGIPTRRNRTF